jgi:kumamolisin
MSASKSRKAVAGSAKKMLPKAIAAGNVDPNNRIQISVLVRSRPTAGGSVRARAAERQEAMDIGAKLPEERQYLSREEFAAQRGADPDDLAKVDAFAHAHNLTVVPSNLAARTVKLEGTIRDLTAAFRPKLKKYKLGSKVFRGRTGSLSVPGDLADIVVGVFGFDNRPVATPKYRRLDETKPLSAAATAKTIKTRAKAGTTASKKKENGKPGTQKLKPLNAPDGSFTPPEVARLYNFPAGLNGKGQCIAIIELNDIDQNGTPTGTGFDIADLKAYFTRLGIPMPDVAAIGVDGGANVPDKNLNTDGEVMLDIEVAGSVAPGAKLAVYFAPNTFQGFIDAVNAAIHDNVRKPSVISISWGGPEGDDPKDQFLLGLDQAFQDAATLGVTVCCSSGDDGSSDIREASARDGKPHVDFPAASPFALACGGTKLIGVGSTISSEEVWNGGNKGGATGGGVSNIFPRPSYQSKAGVPTSPKKKAWRGVPDVAGDADPHTGYQVRTGGQNTVIGGTSAVSPLWAGLVALINERLVSLGKKPAGFINALLYGASPAAGIFHDIVHGNNDIDGTLGKYTSTKGWDPCTGLGTPDGTKLLHALGG